MDVDQIMRVAAAEATPRTIDGRTLLVLVTAVERYMARFPGDATNPKEIASAIANMKYAMEHVHFSVVGE